MKDRLSHFARRTGVTNLSFHPFDPEPLFAGVRFQLAPAVEEYFRTAVPNVTLTDGFYRILSAPDIVAENSELMPGCFCAPHGFLTIASELSGDSFSLDVTDGKIYFVSHGKFHNGMISPGWNADCTDFLPEVPVSRENIIHTAEGSWTGLEAFLDECLEENPAE